MKKTFLLLLAIILFMSCKSNKNITPDYARGLKNIQHNLERESITLQEAYIETTILIEKNTSDKSQAIGFLNEIKTKMDDQANLAFQNEEYETALIYLLSLQAAGYENTKVDLKECYKKLIAKGRKKPKEFIKKEPDSNQENQIDIKSASEDQTTDVNSEMEYRPLDEMTRIQLLHEMADLKLLDYSELGEIFQYYYKQQNSSMFNHSYLKYINLYPNLNSSISNLNKMKEELNQKKQTDF
ncbi:MAG: hypothetical protein MJB14_08245, partial [Spirochaetes bacterium]|nr:hypothetical protein [Spirochaetota bacterium]